MTPSLRHITISLAIAAAAASPEWQAQARMFAAANSMRPWAAAHRQR